MHDTHLIEKIYTSVSEICRRNDIVRVTGLQREGDEGIHITGPLLLEHFAGRDGRLFGPWTEVSVDYNPMRS
jgi:hypothetical protein